MGCHGPGSCFCGLFSLCVLADNRIQETFQATLRDEEPDFSRLTASSRKETPKEEMGIPPTQRMSQVCLLGNLVVNSSLTSHRFVVWVFSTEFFVYLGR